MNFNNKFSNIPWSQILLTILVCINAFTSGLQLAWTSQTIPILISEDSPIPMTLEETSYLGIISYITAILFPLIISKVVDIIGRKYCFFIIVLPQFIGWITIGCANSKLVLYCARAICGLADGGLLIVIPIYLGEILDPKVRGRLGCVVSTALYVGELVVNVVGSYTSISTTAFICSVFPAIFLIIFPFCPESPYFLLMKEKHKKARNALKKLRPKKSKIEEELQQIETDVKRQKSESKSIKDLVFQKSNREALFVAVGLRTAHQLTGIIPFTMYTQYIFDNSGSNLSSNMWTIIFLSLQILVVFFVSLFIDHFGRRPLIIISSFGCTITLAMQSIYYFISEYTSINVSEISWVPVMIMMLYIVVFCVGFAMVPTLMLSELFSVNMKGKALGLMNAYYLLCITITSKVFQLMVGNFGMFVPFIFFTICCLCGSIFCYCSIPETKGKTLEEIQQSFANKNRK